MPVQFVKTKGSNVKGNQTEKTTRINRKALNTNKARCIKQ